MSDHGIGTCGICGGRVAVPAVWYGINPPIPACQSCGATKRKPHGPVIDMDAPRGPVAFPFTEQGK